jgi:hypothetical protein
VRFIAEHKDRQEGGLRWGVESICQTLTEHGCPMAFSTYYEAVGRPPSARVLRDQELGGQIARVHAENYGAVLEWVDWYNHRRLHEHCGDIPPAELETAHHRHTADLTEAGSSTN